MVKNYTYVELRCTESHTIDGSKIFKAHKDILQMFDIDWAVHGQPQFFDPKKRPNAAREPETRGNFEGGPVEGSRPAPLWLLVTRFLAPVKQHIDGVVK